MKKLKWYEVLAIVLLVMLATATLMSCTKKEMYKSPPEPYLIIDKQVKFSGQKRVGNKIKFWVDMPTGFENNLQWYFDYGNSTKWKDGTDTIYFTYKKAGVYYVRVVGWAGDRYKSNMGFSDANKLQILAR